MPKPYSIPIGKVVRTLARLRGGGSALPGLVIEKIDPDFVPHILEQLPLGVVVISGTNGKTTTTKMVVELLESQGLKVFTNRTGSNFIRGVAAALLGEIDSSGNLDKDIAVLELDEAHAVHFVRTTQPRYALLLNVMRDQLDRFGEIDATAALLHTVAEQATEGVVLNRDDPRLGNANFIKNLAVPVQGYGVSSQLRKLFPSDDDLKAPTHRHAVIKTNDDTVLTDIKGQTAIISYAGNSHEVPMQLKGVYNLQNAVGAVALTRMIMGDKLDETRMLEALTNVTPAFGRGETIIVDDQPIELVLVKNPSGFRLSLASFDPQSVSTMIAINDEYADGRDMSWLWDVEFESLRESGVAMVSGLRAYDMALRLQYDLVEISTVDTDVKTALHAFLDKHANQPKRIFCTYTAMLALRRELRKITDVESMQ